jgi:hypothetical protein
MEGGRRTLSRISTRFSASAGLSGGEPLGDCSARNVVETMKGMSWDSTPSFTRSSGAMGGKSGSGVSSVGQARDRGGGTRSGGSEHRRT